MDLSSRRKVATELSLDVPALIVDWAPPTERVEHNDDRDNPDQQIGQEGMAF